MDNLLKLNDLVITDTYLLLWGNNALPADVNNCIFCMHGQSCNKGIGSIYFSRWLENIL
jgi:hypothetical protein